MEQIQNLLNQIAIISNKNAEILDATGGRFNMFRVCGIDHYENKHSAIIAEFLRTNGSHGLKEKFLECFVTMFCNDTMKQVFDCENASVDTERSVDDGRIDILIEDRNKHAIIVENKIYAGDQREQLKRYNNFAEREYGNGNYQIFYLTLWGDDASEHSGQEVDYTCISYQKDIIEWMEKCACIGMRLPMVRETIYQYINHLKSLTNQDMDAKSKEEIVQLLCKPENLDSAFSIIENADGIRYYIVNKIFLPKLTEICDELKLKNVSKECNHDTEFPCFRIVKESWNYFDIWFEFQSKKGLNGHLVYGIIAKNTEKVNLATYKELTNRFNGNYPPRFDVYNEFLPYSRWGKDAMKAITGEEMANIFKTKIEEILDITKDLDLDM